MQLEFNANITCDTVRSLGHTLCYNNNWFSNLLAQQKKTLWRVTDYATNAHPSTS